MAKFCPVCGTKMAHFGNGEGRDICPKFSRHKGRGPVRRGPVPVTPKRRTCPDCKGKGKVPGKRGDRKGQLVQCQTCRGAGKIQYKD